MIRVLDTVCLNLDKFCIASEGLNADCYTNLSAINNYRLTDCNNRPCLQTTVRLHMNNTLYTTMCSQNICEIGSSSLVGTTSKLIVAGKCIIQGSDENIGNGGYNNIFAKLVTLLLHCLGYLLKLQ